VSPSCFAMAELSPFQRGCGSLQIFSVYQRVPAGPAYDFMLTGLRRDAVTAAAPGIFAEVPLETSKDEKLVGTTEYPVAGVRHPCKLGQCLLRTDVCRRYCGLTDSFALFGVSTEQPQRHN
jgi:hypothetical protein